MDQVGLPLGRPKRQMRRSAVGARGRYTTSRAARRRARQLGLRGIHSHGRGKNKIYMPGSTHQAYERALRRKKRGRKKA